MYRDQSMNLK